MRQRLALFSFVLGLMAIHGAHAAEALYYGAQSVDLSSRTEYCYFRATVPLLAPIVGADSSTQEAARAINQHFQDELDKIQNQYQHDTRGRCANETGTNQITLTFTVPTALDADIISFVISQTSFQGPTQPIRVWRPETFDSQTGEVLPSVASFLKSSSLLEFKKLIEQQLSLVIPNFNPEAGWNTIRASWTSLEKITNYYFTPEGLVVLFNDFDLSPSAYGTAKVLLEWTDLQRLGLLATGPATKLKTYP